MTDLTEKWKNGELENGMYYMENTSGIIGRVGHSKAFPCYNVKQILAPVPSYEEWQKLNGGYDWLTLRNKALEDENDKLKELLKECRYIFDECFSPSVKFGVLYKEIDEVLK